jgi:hypothetical protein
VREPNFGWDYPPGVTGREPEIAGYPDCANCGHDPHAHGDGPCEEIGCECKAYDQYGEEVEP